VKPIINLEETPGKVVGSNFPTDPVEAYERLLRISKGVRPPPPFPQGVFRFKTLAEADAWKWKYIMKAAAKNFPAPRTSTR
jgi:hypothetical protein